MKSYQKIKIVSNLRDRTFNNFDISLEIIKDGE